LNEIYIYKVDFPRSVLERRLSIRPSKEDLKLRNILRSKNYIYIKTCIKFQYW